jgi:hypothetical protein
LVDGTLIACANYPGCRSLSEFAGHASYGYCPSKSLFVWGMRLDPCEFGGLLDRRISLADPPAEPAERPSVIVRRLLNCDPRQLLRRA